MVVGIISICIINCIYSYLKESNIYNPIFLFNSIWALILVLFELHLYDITDVAFDIKIIILCGVISFNLGAFLSRTIRTGFRNEKGQFSPDSLRKGLHLMQLTSGIVLSYGVVIAARVILLGDSLSYYRYNILTPVVRRGLYGYISLYIGEAMVFATAPLAIYLVFLGFKQEAITELLLFVEYFIFSGGGRNNLLVIIVSAFTCYCFFRKSIILDAKIKRIIRILSTFALAMIVIVPIMRGSNVFKSLYQYFCGTVKAFEIVNRTIDYKSTYGLLSVQGFFRPIYIILRSLGLSIINTLDYKYGKLDMMIELTEGNYWNSAYTGIGFIYTDGGIPGVIIIMGVIGYICVYIYKKAQKGASCYRMKSYSCAKYICLYCFAALLIIQMFADLASANIRYGMGVIWLMLSIKCSERIRLKML